MLFLVRSAPLVWRGLLLGALTVAGNALAQVGECPQPRFTGRAPDDYIGRVNPVAPSGAARASAEAFFLGKARNANCSVCHGKKGDGRGPLASQYDPPPRNFSCAATVNGVPDGQLFWIIRFGSPGTAMPPHPNLQDEQIWQLVLYLRQLAR